MRNLQISDFRIRHHRSQDTLTHAPTSTELSVCCFPSNVCRLSYVFFLFVQISFNDPCSVPDSSVPVHAHCPTTTSLHPPTVCQYGLRKVPLRCQPCIQSYPVSPSVNSFACTPACAGEKIPVNPLTYECLSRFIHSLRRKLFSVFLSLLDESVTTGTMRHFLVYQP